MQKNNYSQSVYAPHIALFAVQLFFGASAVLGKLSLLSFPAIAIVGFRAAGGAAAFYALQRFRGGLKLDKTSHYFYFFIFSLFGVIFNHLLFFTGLSYTTAVNASLLAVMIPIFTIIISVIARLDKLSWRKAFGIILASAGVIYLIDPSRASFSSETTVGNILLILNGFSYALYIVISKKLVSHYGALKSIAWIFIFGAMINFPLGLYSLQSVTLSEVTLTGWLATIGVVLFPTILAYYWNAWALTKVSPGIVAIYIYLQPVIGFFLAIVFLNEAWSYRILTAMILIFLGVYLANYNRKIQKCEMLHLT